MDKYFYVVPGDHPLTRQEAYRKACDLFGVHRREARQGYYGIAWTGLKQDTLFETWAKLPPSTA